jgi:hypothetical protein
MKPLKILITNISLSGRSGTETVARDLALGLVRRGHLPVVYSPMLSVPGQRGVANEIREALVPVTDDLRSMSEPPDLIHGNHLHETLTACLRFPDTPAIWVCHSWDGPHDRAPNFPTIMKYLAVDEACLERLLSEEAIPISKSQLLLNCVDLNRFKPRPQLPSKPKKALLLSHYAANSLWFEMVQDACAQTSLELDAVGAGLERISDSPETLMLDYDIVFAVDRTALEATCVGNAVILCGQPGLGPIVTSKNCEQIYNQNFGRKWLNEPVSVQGIVKRIEEYDAVDAQKASAITVKRADSDRYFEELDFVYENALHDFRERTPADSDHKVALECSSDYMRQVSAAVRTHIWGNDEHLQMKIQRDGLAETAERRRLRLERIERERHEATILRDKSEVELAEMNLLLQQQIAMNQLTLRELDAAKAQLSSTDDNLRRLQSSKTVVLKNRILRIFGL